MEIAVSPNFVKSYKKIPEHIKKLAQKKEVIFRKNPFDTRLKTHKLIGEKKECWSFSINYSYRIMFIFLDENKILFLNIGTHAIYN